MIKKIIIIMFLLQNIVIFGKYYDYSSNIYRDYTKNDNKEFIIKNFKPLNKLLSSYNSITENKERFNFIKKLKNGVIKDYFELKYYQRIDNQIEFQKKLFSIKLFDVFLTLPFLLYELKNNDYLAYQKLVNEIYEKYKKNRAILLYYEDEFIENTLNTDLIDSYFLKNKFHTDRLIEKYKKLEYKKAIKKILKILDLYPKSVRVFSQVISWNEFFRENSDFVDIINLYPFIKKNPYLLYQITKLSIGELLKNPSPLLEIKNLKAKALYRLISGENEVADNSFFKKELKTLNQKELNNENKILKIDKNITLNKDMGYTINQKEAIYFANTKIEDLFYEILYIDKEELLKVNNVYIYRNENEIIRLNDYEFVIPYEYEGLYSDMKILKYFLREYLQKGDVFFIDYTITSTEKRDYFNHKISILENIKPKSDIISYNYSLKYPRETKLKIAYNKNYLTKTEEKEGHFNKLNFTGENLKTFISEPYYYFSYKEEPYISISNFSDWQEVKVWFKNIIFDKKHKLSKKNIDFFKKLVKDNKLNKKDDIIRFFYAYILDNVHYVGIELGIHSYKPYSPNSVFENKYGDCKDRAVLFYNIMKQFDIKVEIVLVSTNDFGIYNFEIPSYSYFNHAIVYLPKLNKFLDLTNKKIPYSYLPYSDINSKILILSKKSNIGDLKIKENELIKKEFTYTPDKNDLKIKLTEYYYGNTLNYVFKVDFDKLSDFIYERYISKYYGRSIELLSYHSTNKKRIDYSVLNFEYILKDKINNKVSIIKLFQNSDLFENKFTPNYNRVNNFYFITSFKYEYEFKFLNLKNIYSFESKLIENTFFKAELKIKNNIIYFKFNMKTKLILAEENKKFKKKLKELDDLLQKKYYLEFK